MMNEFAFIRKEIKGPGSGRGNLGGRMTVGDRDDEGFRDRRRVGGSDRRNRQMGVIFSNESLREWRWSQ